MAQTDGTIRLLRHAAGRILAVTESGQVLTFRDDGAWKTQVTQGAFNVAGLSERYAFLATRNKPMLSAFEWTANGNDILTYYNDEASNEYEYYEHLDARVNSDGQTAMLFRSTGFRIYNLESGERIDANSDSEETKFEREASALIYQRGPRLSDDPAQECLKVIASNGVSFYSATSGKLLYSRERREADDYPVYFTQSYKIEQKGVSAPIEILQQRSNAPLKTVRENLLISASQYEDYLILSLSTLERERYSLILDKNLDVIGRVPGPCDALPANTLFQFLRDGRANGALIFDDMQGRLLQGSLYTLEDLWSLAINWRMETE